MDTLHTEIQNQDSQPNEENKSQSSVANPTAHSLTANAASIAASAFGIATGAGATAAGTPIAQTSKASVGSQAAIPANTQLPSGPQVSEYLDYRQFLQDFYLYKRSQTQNQLRPYTYSVFAASADIKSPNYLKMIIEGKRNLSDDMILKFAKALSLNKARTNEFRLLVLFNQATDPSERNVLLKQLSEVRVEG